jgi:Tol biopolymer transport system component
MTKCFGPWATAASAGSKAHLSTFWKRRLAMLPATHRSSTRLGGRVILLLLITAGMVWALPTLWESSVATTQAADGPAVAEGEPSTSDASSAKPGTIYLCGNLKTIPGAGENARELRGIFAVDPEYGAWRQITDMVGLVPRASSDGKKLAMVTAKKDRLPGLHVLNGIWTCSTQPGSQATQISDKGGLPVWSPNGQEIVVTVPAGDSKEGGDETWRMNADGSGATRVSLPGTDFIYDWSSEGKWCVASVDSGHPGRFSHPCQLYVMRPDGTQRQNLTKEGRNLFARFSPDGSQIVYLFTDPDGKKSRSLRVMNTDGSGDRELVGDAGLVIPEDACWSPDGKYLAVRMVACEELQPDGNRVGRGDWHLEIVAATGRHRRWLNLVGAHIESFQQPDWAPQAWMQVGGSPQTKTKS